MFVICVMICLLSFPLQDLLIYLSTLPLQLSIYLCRIQYLIFLALWYPFKLLLNYYFTMSLVPSRLIKHNYCTQILWRRTMKPQSNKIGMWSLIEKGELSGSKHKIQREETTPIVDILCHLLRVTLLIFTIPLREPLSKFINSPKGPTSEWSYNG